MYFLNVLSSSINYLMYLNYVAYMFPNISEVYSDIKQLNCQSEVKLIVTQDSEQDF